MEDKDKKIVVVPKAKININPKKVKDTYSVLRIFYQMNQNHLLRQTKGNVYVKLPMRDIQLKLLTILRHNFASSSLLSSTMIFAKCFGSPRARLTKLCCMVAMLISNQYSISSCHWLSDIGA